MATRVRAAVLAAAASVGVLAGISGVQAGIVFQANFDSAAGTSNGDAITGSVGGTATIRHVGTDPTWTSQVISDGFAVGNGALQISTNSATPSQAPQGATITPSSSANSLNAGFIADPNPGTGTDHYQLNMAFDFFFKSDVAIDADPWAERFRFIDTGNRNNGQMRVILSSTNDNDLVLNVQFLAGGAVGIDVPSTQSVVAGRSKYQSGFSIRADDPVHIGVTVSTDPISGDVTLKIFGVHGTGLIDTSETVLSTPSNPTALLAQGTIAGTLMDQARIGNTAAATYGHVGFNSGAFDIGMLTNWSTTRTQVFDQFTVYDSDPDQFSAIPEPTATAVLGMTSLAMLRRCRRH